MSMILDALKRSREDGDVSNAVPSIDTSHEFTAKKVVPFIGSQGLAISIGVVACIAIGLLTMQNVSQGQLGEPPLEQDPVVATLALGIVAGSWVVSIHYRLLIASLVLVLISGVRVVASSYSC